MKKRKPHIEFKVAFRGEFRLVLNEGTDQEKDTGWMPNLITDGGLDRLGSGSSSTFRYGSIGTGTTAPVNANTSLQAFVAQVDGATVDSQSNDGYPTYEGQCQMHWVYAQGAVVGNMGEIGVGWGTSGTNLWSRALILDGGGSPTTLTVTSLDQLTVYYKLTCAPVLSGTSSAVTISGTSYSYSAWLANGGNFMTSLYSEINSAGSGRWGTLSGSSGKPSVAYAAAGTLGPITGAPSGTSANVGTAATGTYTNGNKYLDSTLTIAPAEANLSGGIGCLMLNYMTSQAQFQYQFTAPGAIPKDNTKTFTLTARFSWDRV